MEKILENKTVLLVGGTGSLGNALLKTMASAKYGVPKEIIILSRDETKQYKMQQEFKQKERDDVNAINLHYIIGDIRDKYTIRSSLNNVDIVLNLAALKHVPPYEYFPNEAIKTNLLGVQNIVDEIKNGDYNIETMCQISTDKACKPVNVYGMTKAIAERVVISGNLATVDTNFICVRYGNVIESRGSVIPFFKDCIQKNKEIPLTHEDMTRFMMTLEQSCELIFRALEKKIPGSTLIPQLVSSKVVDLIEVLKNHYNKPNIKTKNIGIRPGEKIHEVLISEEEFSRTKIIGEDYIILPQLRDDLYGSQFQKFFKKYDESKIEEANLKEEYSSKNSNVSVDELKDLLLTYGVLT